MKLTELIDFIFWCIYAPYQWLWDIFTSKPSASGHTSGLCEGVMDMWMILMLVIHGFVAGVSVAVYIIFF